MAHTELYSAPTLYKQFKDTPMGDSQKKHGVAKEIYHALLD